jgi:hypothetical protein
MSRISAEEMPSTRLQILTIPPADMPLNTRFSIKRDNGDKGEKLDFDERRYPPPPIAACVPTALSEETSLGRLVRNLLKFFEDEMAQKNGQNEEEEMAIEEVKGRRRCDRIKEMSPLALERLKDLLRAYEPSTILWQAEDRENGVERGGEEDSVTLVSGAILDFEPFMSLCPSHYTRNLISNGLQDGTYNLILLVWAPGSTR